jgi:ferredoxin
MIITKQKEFNDLLNSIDDGSVFIIGCNECATLCHTGGEEEVLEMKDALENKNINVTGWVVLEPACHLNNDKRLLKSHRGETDKSKKILVLACGNGAQTVSEAIEGADVIAGTDTLFLGEIRRASDFEKRCVMCGDCVLDVFIGLCPVSRCPKHMLNGPCGGSKNGKCEIDADLDCVWELLYNCLKEKGLVQVLQEIEKPKDWSKSIEMRRTL